ncbi:MAG: hypothetical protein QUS35_11155 [bacterium]|nr:hypothetical protein [bacterium]
MKISRGLALLLCVGGFCAASAQEMRFLEIQGGVLNPKGARRTGLIFGANYGVSVDERVDLGLGVSLYHKGYREETGIDTSRTGAGSEVHLVSTPLEYSTTIIPLTANVTVHIPFQPPLGYYIGGSLAYELLFDKYTNYETGDKDNARFGGFGWMARAGAELTIGTRSSLTLEAFYNGCTVKADRKKVSGMPTWEEVDLSGIGFRGGIRVELY